MTEIGNLQHMYMHLPDHHIGDTNCQPSNGRDKAIFFSRFWHSEVTNHTPLCDYILEEMWSAMNFWIRIESAGWCISFWTTSFFASVIIIPYDGIAQLEWWCHHTYPVMTKVCRVKTRSAYAVTKYLTSWFCNYFSDMSECIVSNGQILVLNSRLLLQKIR